VKATTQIFLSYAREDEGKVESLYQRFSDTGVKPWMDKKDILPGEIWRSSVQKAIRRSDFFLACLSVNSLKRGFLQREIKEALDIRQEMLDSDIYLIPVRLEDCEVPEGLCDFQWVNLFEEDGWTRLMEAIQMGGDWDPDAREQILRERINLYVERKQWRPAIEAALRRIDILPLTEPSDEQHERHRLLNDLMKAACEELAQLYVRCAEADLALDNLEGAVDSYEKAEQLCQKIEDWQGMREIQAALAETYERWAEVRAEVHRWADAIKHYQSALMLYEKLGSPANIALTQYHLGRLRKEQPEKPEAVSCFEKCLEYRRDNEGEFLIPFKIILSAYKEIIQARLGEREFHLAVLQFCKKADDLFIAGQTQDAIDAAQEALRLSRAQAQELIFDSQLCLGRLLMESGKWERAIDEYEVVLEMAGSLGDEKARIEILDRLKQAVKKYRVDLKLAETQGDKKVQNEIQNYLDRLQKVLFQGYSGHEHAPAS